MQKRSRCKQEVRSRCKQEGSEYKFDKTLENSIVHAPNQ